MNRWFDGFSLLDCLRSGSRLIWC
uniref:Uncharacterized protein n=1 Tax=Tetranychus urticae TaxID=32264 RepID=T1KQQ6_TETUR